MADVPAPQEQLVDATNKVSDEAAAFYMFGITGLTRYGPISRVYEEFLRELQGPQGMRSWREMIDNDPIIGAILFIANHLSRKVHFSFKPANQTNAAKRIADFVGGAIFDDLESSWPDTLSEILTMLGFGWSLLEYDFKRRLGPEPPQFGLPDYGTIAAQMQFGDPQTFQRAPSRFGDGLLGFRSWSLRSQETLFQWEFDDRSNAVVMEQQAPPDYKIRRIPLAKSLLFRTQVAKNNPEGRSLLRNAWTSYYFKKNIQVFEGIGIERDLAGYPVIQIKEPTPGSPLLPPDIWNTQDQGMMGLLATLKQMVRSVRRDEQEGMVLPWWAEFKLLNTGSKRSFDTNAIITRYDQRMAMSVASDFILLGHTSVGSKALAETKVSLFTSSISSFLDTACSIINRQAVPVLMTVNRFPMELAPVMEHGNVEEVDLEELGNFIKAVAGTGVNPFADSEVQTAILQLAKLPTGARKSVVGDSTEGEGSESDDDVLSAMEVN